MNAARTIDESFRPRFAIGNLPVLAEPEREGQPVTGPGLYSQAFLLDISEDSMRGAIALSYYFIACGIKAHRKFISSPVDELPGMQKTIYNELPQSFETKAGLLVAERYGMPERSFKRYR